MPHRFFFTFTLYIHTFYMHFYIFLLSALFIMQGYSQHFTSKDVSGDPDHLIVTIYLIKEQFNPLLVALIF